MGEREREWENKRRSAPIHWFALLVVATVRTGTGSTMSQQLHPGLPLG